MIKIFFITLFILGHLTEKSQQRDRPKKCFIFGNDAKCTGMSFIPPLPLNITRLSITKSTFYELTNSTFKNLTNNKISTLWMFRNGLHSISTDAFAIFNELSFFEISKESYLSANDIVSSLSSLNVSNVRKWLFTNNSWTSLPSDMFSILNASSIERISLDDNNFPVFNTSVLSPMKFLTQFSCERCSISHLNTNGNVFLKRLRLNDNKISEFPDFCNNVGIKQHLHDLHLSHNALTSLNSKKLACLENLRKLFLDSNPIKTLVRQTFVKMPCLEILQLNYMHSLRTLQGSVFSSKSLRSLSLKRSFHFENFGTYQVKLIFNRIQNLSLIDLSENVLPSSKYLTRMFSHLKTIKTLLLVNTRITDIPEGLFQMMPELKDIILHGNRIPEWNTRTFLGMNAIEKLDLSGNAIKLINSTSFPKNLLDKVRTLDLSSNPFSCTCDLVWFRNLLNTNITSKLKTWPKWYSCGSPKSLKYMPLIKYNPTESKCNQMGLFYIITIVVCSLVISSFFVVLGICKCQSNIKNLIYYVRLQMMARKGYSKIQSGSDFLYHVFVVYCEADRHWVHQKLLPKLEREGIIVCVHHRDFDVGKPITENITDCMNNSWKMIVVLSNKFAKSEWCLWELDLVQERRRRVGNEAVVVIVYQDIDSRHMTSRLRSLLMTSSSLKFNDGIGKQLFWKAVIKNINKPLSLPPTSQL